MDPELKIATHNSIPNQEYSLYGSVLEAHLETLLHRLRGLCGTMPGNGEQFEDHYLTYVFKHVTPPVTVRAVRSVLFSSVPWRFQYFGDTGGSDANKMVTQRQIIDACCSVRLPKFLEDGLGFSIESEYILKGSAFAKGRVKILVGRVMKGWRRCAAVPVNLYHVLLHFSSVMNLGGTIGRHPSAETDECTEANRADVSGGVEGGEAVSGSYLVEVSAVAFGGSANEPAANDVIAFAELLQPIVKLEKVDFKKLQTA